MDEDDIPDTRVFVSGLPPHYTREQLGAHFAGRYQITDSVVIPGRRIGFVGFRNYTLAKNAVKYFDKSYIRMSKISVEIAKPVDFHREINADPEADSNNDTAMQPQQVPLGATASSESNLAFTPYESVTTKSPNKRKRAEGQEQSKEMKEYMEVMQPKSKSMWANGEFKSRTDLPGIEHNKQGGAQAEVAKVKQMKKSRKGDRATEVPDTAAMAEFSDVERKRRKKEKKEKKTQLKTAVSPVNEEPVVDTKEARKNRKAEKKLEQLRAESNAEGGVEPLNDDASGFEVAKTDIVQPENPKSDNEWLRGKTSRLLDLVEPEDHPVIEVQTNEPPKKVLETAESSNKDDDPKLDEQLGMAADVMTDFATLTSSAKAIAVPNGRLFVRNMPFNTTESDLQVVFAKYGSIAEVHVSRDFKSSSSKGIAFVQFFDSDGAESALRALDGKTFQGRLLHILPASDKKVSQLDDFTLSTLPLKKQKAIKQKKEATSSAFSWNSLYMNPDAVLSSIADRLGVPKSQVLDPTSSDAAVKQALAETNTIKDTKSYLQNHGVNIDAFKNTSRNDRTLLLKNFSFGTTSDELQGLLNPFGLITRLILPPTGTMAIAQYEDAHSTAQALKNLAYRNLKGSVLFLEKAPQGIFDVPDGAKKFLEDPATAATGNVAIVPNFHTPDPASATVFVRNLNFATTNSRLAEVFNPLPGFISATIKTRTDPKRPREILSMGFGFVEFNGMHQAAAAITSMNGYILDGHQLLVKASTKMLDAAEETRRADKAKKTEKKTKIIIKNLPFEASKKDIKALFGAYGQLRTVRVPKKFDQSARGFAFADFVTPKEAENAMEALSNTHLLGRRLVLDFAAGEVVDPDEEIQALERKMGQQNEMVRVSQITGSTRRKFNVEAREGDEQL